MLGWLRRRQDTAVADHEIVPGTDKPTLILVNMVVAKAIKDPKKTSDWASSDDRKYKFEDGEITATVTVEDVFHSAQRRVKIGEKYHSAVVTCGKKEFQLHLPQEREALAKGLKKAASLRAAVIQAEKEAERQDDALAAIEEFFKPKPVEQPEDRCPHGKLECDDSCLPKDLVTAPSGAKRERLKGGKTKELLSPLEGKHE